MTTGTAAIISIIVLGGAYSALFPSANQGYGNVGYGGYYHRQSYWNMGGPNIYRDKKERNLRHSSSSSGARFSGGGPGSGK